MKKMSLMAIVLFALSAASSVKASCPADFLAGEYVLEGQQSQAFPASDRDSSADEAPSLPEGLELAVRLEPQTPVSFQLLSCDVLEVKQGTQVAKLWLTPTDTYHQGWGFTGGLYAERVTWSTNQVHFALRHGTFLYRKADIKVSKDADGNLVVSEKVLANGFPGPIWPPAVLADLTYVLRKVQ